MEKRLLFLNRHEFRLWLEEHGESEEGVWLLFGKKHGPVTLSAQEALEEALCFGWIDGQMRSIDETAYIKYFAKRRAKSKWSEKNKKLAARLTQQGLMREAGRAKIAEAKANGQWDKAKADMITEEHIHALAELLRAFEPAYTNFMAMTPSVQKTYTKAYLDAKTEAGRERRIAWLVERLDKNLKPMEQER